MPYRGKLIREWFSARTTFVFGLSRGDSIRSGLMTDLPNQPANAGRGCLFYGGIAALVLFVLIIAGAIVGVRHAKKMLSDFTDPAPRPLPSVQTSPAETAALRKRVDDFRDAVRAGREPAPLSLNADEINKLIATDDDLAPLKGHLWVSAIEGDHIKVQMSAPLEQLGLPIFRGRYLNSDGRFAISLRSGLLFLKAQEMFVRGKPIPENYMQVIRAQNLAKPLNENRRVSVALDRLKSIELKDGQLIIVPAPPSTQ